MLRVSTLSGCVCVYIYTLYKLFACLLADVHKMSLNNDNKYKSKIKETGKEIGEHQGRHGCLFFFVVWFAGVGEGPRG